MAQWSSGDILEPRVPAKPESRSKPSYCSCFQFGALWLQVLGGSVGESLKATELSAGSDGGQGGETQK